MGVFKAFVSFFKGMSMRFLKKKVHTVEGVEAVYESAILEAQEKYEKSTKRLINILGNIQNTELKIEQVKHDIENIVSSCETEVANNNMGAAKILAQKKTRLDNQLSSLKENLEAYKVLDKEVTKINNKHEKDLEQLKLDKDKDINEVSLRNEVNDIYKELDPNRDASESDSLIKYVQNDVRDNAKAEIAGNKILYDRKGISTGEEDIDSDSKKFLDELVAKQKAKNNSKE
jgi:phage shock protein A